MLVLGGVTAGTVLAVSHATTVQSAIPAGAVPGLVPSPAAGNCLTEVAARNVWQSVDNRLNALELHPTVAGVEGIALGSAAAQLRQYVQQRLLDQHLTEREVQRLQSLTVLQAGCGGQPLTVRASVTLVRDDYLAPDGHVDHRDPGVGQTSEVLESFVRSSGGWKVITIASLGGPAASSPPTV